MRKCVFERVRTARAISSCIRAFRSGPLLPANRIIGYYRMSEWRAEARMLLCTAQNELNLRILRIFEVTFSLDAAQILLPSLRTVRLKEQ